MGLDGKTLVKQWEQIAADRGTWESTWQDIADNILGRRDFQTEHITGGRRRMQMVYDGTARFSVSALSGGLHSMLTNPSAEWFHLKPEDNRLLDDRDVAIWFEDAEQQMYNAINRPEARFSSQQHEVYTDIVAFGTAAMFIEDQPGVGVAYSSRPLAEMYVSENNSGVVDTIFRKFMYTARQAIEVWGDGAPEKAKKAMAAGKSEERHKYLHTVRPATSPLPLPFRPSGFPWESAFVSIDEQRVLSSGGYEEMPFMVPRWEKDSGETYGRGPGFVALADAQMLNEMKKTMLQTGALKVRPPTVGEDEDLVPDLRPGQHNVVRPGSQGFGIQPMPIGGDLGWGVELIRDTREQVQRAFHWELLQLIRDPRMTATQVLEISSNIQRLLAPILGRHHSEMLEPMIERTFGILLRRGMFLPPPPALEGAQIKVEYVSPVARAQKDQDTRAIVELFTVGANLAQADPTVLDVMASDEAMRLIADQKGVPLRALRSREQVEEIRAGRAEAQAAEAERAQQIQQAETAAKVLPALQNAGALQ